MRCIQDECVVLLCDLRMRSDTLMISNISVWLRMLNDAHIIKINEETLDPLLPNVTWTLSERVAKDPSKFTEEEYERLHSVNIDTNFREVMS